MNDYSEIQNAFLEGMELVFTVLFTDDVRLLLFDKENNKPNIYNELQDKKYLEAIQLVGKVIPAIDKEDAPEMSFQYDIRVTIPTKQMITNGIARETEDDLEELTKAVIEYKGWRYSVIKVVPKTLVADEWHFYDFFCSQEKKSL